MKNKLISKGLVLVTIILLMSTTPLLVANKVNENIHPVALKDFGNNSLGTVTLMHYALYYRYLKFHGLVVIDYEPPEDNPNYDYYFCEIDGKVRMNFSLTVIHRLNAVVPFLFDRYTWINDLWIGKGPVDYFRIQPPELCYSEAFVTYYVNLTEDAQIVDLITNGENVTIQFWLYGMPAVTNSGSIHNIMEIILPGIKQDLLKPVGGSPIEINIIPVQC